jgi:DNA-binding response OmpR family regulator
MTLADKAGQPCTAQNSPLLHIATPSFSGHSAPANGAATVCFSSGFLGIERAHVSSETLAPRADESADLPAVLLVEDEVTTRKSMGLFLNTCGYASIEAPTVERAVEALSTGISAAVLDVHLAGDRSGLEVLTPIRVRPELADIPVIVLTGGILTDAEEALIKQRHAYIFYKPEGCETIVSFLDRLRGRPTGMPISTRFDDGLRHDFLARAQRESWWLQSSLTTGLDSARAREIVHRWAGVGGTLGFAGISRRALQLQAMLDEPETATADRLRAAVNEIARLYAAVMETPLERGRVLTDVLDALGGQLAGKKIALVGFDTSEATWMAQTLEQAGAFSRVLDLVNAGIGLRALDPFDMVVIAASLDHTVGARMSTDAVAAIILPVLLIGPTAAVARKTSTLQEAARDFLIAPCSPEEFLLRASRLLSGTATRPQSHRDAIRHGRRVVVADDDPTITSLVRTAFQNYEFECHIARDGGQALELTRSLQPDALVLDVNMPQFDGFEVLHALKNDPATACVAVVLLSARQQEADIMRGFSLGADDYVVKPFSPIELIARVKRLLRKPAA